MLSRKASAAGAAVLLLSLAGCGPAAEEPLSLLADWSGVDTFVVSDRDGETVLSGVDVDSGRTDPVAVIAGRGDTRADRSAQVLQTAPGHFLVVLAGATAHSADVYDVDVATRRVDLRTTLTGGQSLLRVADGYVGVSSPSGTTFELQPFDPQLQSLAPVPMSLTPSYASADPVGGGACYAGGDGTLQQVGVYRGGEPELAERSFAFPGNLTGIDCSNGRVVVAIGDVPRGAGSTPAPHQPITVTHEPGDVDVTVLAASLGSSGKVASTATGVIADVQTADGPSLVALDPDSGQVQWQAALPQAGTVRWIQPVEGALLVEGTDRLFVVPPGSSSATPMTVVGDLYDIRMQLLGPP